MVNLLHIYLPGRFHLVSILVAIASVLVAYYFHPKAHPIYRFMNSMLVNVFAHFMYENVFMSFYRASGRGIDSGTPAGLKLYLASTILLGLGIYVSNKKFRFMSRKNLKYSIYLFFILLFSLSYLYSSNWFMDLYYWYRGGPDPHNVWWFISKVSGFFIWVFLVGDKK